MKIIKIILMSSLALSFASLPAFGRGPGGGGGGCGQMLRDPSLCPFGGVPLRDGSGKNVTNRGNPNSTGTPLKDGSGKATAPGRGAKDGTGNRARCPNT